MKRNISKAVKRVSLAGVVGAGALILASCGAQYGPPSGAHAPRPAAVFTGGEASGSTVKKVGSITTGSLRSGDTAITRDSINSILNNPQKRDRPGLGTGWGNAVDSQMGYTTFRRKSGKPAGVATIYYNNKEGVKAMTGGHHWSGKGMQRAANGLVEWGVKGGWGHLSNVHANGRRYVIGKRGSKYTLVVKNICDSRLEMLFSVDGLDVMDGKTASFKKRGYIVEPGKTLEVKGFRTSAEAVAAFKFSSVGASYSNMRHGATRNVGVMGLAVFTEKGVDPWRWSKREINNRANARAFAEAPALKAR